MNRWQNSNAIERGEDEGEGHGAISRLIEFECIGIRVRGHGTYIAQGNVRARVPRVPKLSNESRFDGQVLAIPR